MRRGQLIYLKILLDKVNNMAEKNTVYSYSY